MSTTTRLVLVTVGLALVHPTFAAEKKRRDAPSAPVAREKQATVDPKLIDAVARARFLFISRVEMCSPPQKCAADTITVVDDAEKTFVNACTACASEKSCEDDRASIREGKARRQFNPCEQVASAR